MDQKSKYIKNITSSFIFKLGMLKYLPSLFFWGVRVKALNEESSAIVLKYSWTTKNPFGSIYFSALAGAAELSTGVLVQLHIQDSSSYSMLVVESTARFLKKAKGTITFACDQGAMVKSAIQGLNDAGNSCTFILYSTAIDESGTAVGNFSFNWSVKKK